jgi:hypothetical protein
MAHTPGPWIIKEDSSDTSTEAEVIEAENRIICWTANSWDESRHRAIITDEDRANGSLISAAPELLEALQDTKDELIALYERLHPNDETDNDTTRVIDRAIAAIEIATGG